MAHLPKEISTQQAISILPLELFLHVLDQLVGARDSLQPVAYRPSDTKSKTLRSLTLVSRSIHLIASRYLYAYCIHLNNHASYDLFRRTLGLDVLHRSQASRSTKLDHNNHLFAVRETPQYITSAFISPIGTRRASAIPPPVRVRQVIDLCNIIGLTLKRLVMNLLPMCTATSDTEAVGRRFHENNIALSMPHLEELVTSHDILDFFTVAPPNLKRLAVTYRGVNDVRMKFCFSMSSLEMLVYLRPPELSAQDIDSIFSSYKGTGLDVILVDVNSNHRTPTGTRDWGGDDVVKIWEVDVPTSFYGDEDELILCDDFVWAHGENGTLWNQNKRRMASWAEIRRRLDGPVHMIMDGFTS
jgi:hypothetical protein